MNTNIKSLWQTYEAYFPIGTAVNATTIHTHKDLLVKHFNSLTAENEMKFGEVHPAENSYYFEKADSIAEFALKNNMKLRGHTLLWHGQTSDWVFKNGNGTKVSREVLLKRLEDHINTVVGRYKDRIYCWDVVNEAIEDKSSHFFRQTEWLDILGEDFIEKAFQLAHKADPKAMLFYNDYNACYPEKRDKIYQLVRNLKEREIPIHGIGLQGHFNIYTPTLEEIKQAIDKYASLGIKLQITELDVSVYEFEDHRSLKMPTHEMIDKQADFYGKFFELLKEYKEVINGVTFWGPSDDVTWLNDFPVYNRQNWPLLFDNQHQPKEAYWRIVQ